MKRPQKGSVYQTVCSVVLLLAMIVHPLAASGIARATGTDVRTEERTAESTVNGSSLTQNLDEFVTVEGRNLMLNGKRFRFVGANTYWLGLREKPDIDYPSDGDIERLFEDSQALGIDVIRTFAALSVGSAGGTNKSIQPSPGTWNETALRKLDKVLQLAGEYNIRLILPLVDMHDYYSGGVATYTSWRGLGDKSLFFTDSAVKQDYRNFLNMVVNRTNYYTGVTYKDDPTIFCWELGNELWHASTSTLDSWVDEMSLYLKGIDSNHLVMSGAVYAGFAQNTSADILTHHIYPNLAPAGTTDLNAWMINELNYATYQAKSLADSGNGKPIIIGEFGWSEQFLFDGVNYGMQDRNEVFRGLLENAYDKGNNGVDDWDTDGMMIWHLSTKQDAMNDIDPLHFDVIYRPPYPTAFNSLMGQTTNMLKYWQSRMQGATPVVPAVPSGLHLEGMNKAVKLEWTPSASATSYTIQRSGSMNGPYRVIAYGVPVTSYIDKSVSNAQAYYYKVSAESQISGGISAYSPASGPIVPSEWDYMWNFDNMYSHTSNLEFDSSNSAYFNGDTSRLYRPKPGNENQNIVYMREDHTITRFSAVTFHWPNETLRDFTFHTSTDGVNWSLWAPGKVNHGGNWIRIDYSSDASHPIPTNTKYIKMSFPTGTEHFSPQISGVSITFTGTTLIDELNDWSRAYAHSPNLTFDSSSPGNFEGDTSRVHRTGPDNVNLPAYPRESIIYKLRDIKAFKAISYYWYVSGEEQAAEMYFDTSSDGVTWTPYAPSLLVTQPAGVNWKKHTYETAALPSGVHYLRIYFPPGGKHPWNPQLSRVEISNS